MSEKPAEKTVAAIAPTVTPPAPPMPVVAVVKPPLSYTQKVMIAVGIAMAALLLSMLVYQISQILVLMFAGLLLAVFVSAPADLLAKYTRLERTYALGLVLLGLLIVVAGGGYFVGFTITRQVEELTRTLPGRSSRPRRIWSIGLRRRNPRRPRPRRRPSLAPPAPRPPRPRRIVGWPTSSSKCGRRPRTFYFPRLLQNAPAAWSRPPLGLLGMW